MNAKQDLLRRLLHLYPIENVKEYFNINGKISADDAIGQIIATNRYPAIIKYSFLSHSLTKQNVYLFELDRNFSRNIIGNDFPLTIENEVLNAGEHTFFCLPEVVYSVYLSNPTDKEDLHFFQPLTLKIRNKTLIISYTKLVKHVNAHYPDNREARKASEVNTEDVTLRSLISYLKNSYHIEAMDLNKGVKHLWDKDSLDCHKVLSNKQHCVTLTTMHGLLTFKQQYPKEYIELVKEPLGSSHWKYLVADEQLCETFICDPNAGQLSIPKFPKHSNQVENVINKILANN